MWEVKVQNGLGRLTPAWINLAKRAEYTARTFRAVELCDTFLGGQGARRKPNNEHAGRAVQETHHSKRGAEFTPALPFVKLQFVINLSRTWPEIRVHWPFRREGREWPNGQLW